MNGSRIHDKNLPQPFMKNLCKGVTRGNRGFFMATQQILNRDAAGCTARTRESADGAAAGAGVEQKRSGSWSFGDGGGKMRTAFGLSSRGGSDREGSMLTEESVPPEVSGMLHRYSEMMLRVVQVRRVGSGRPLAWFV